MPNVFISALGSVFKALHARLMRSGVKVGETAGYPRIEIHSIVESAWLDKGTLKQVDCIVECISDKRIHDVLEMNEENLRRMLGEAMMLDEGWEVAGIVSGQLQEMTETTDTKDILYRLLQNMTIYVELTN